MLLFSIHHHRLPSLFLSSWASRSFLPLFYPGSGRESCKISSFFAAEKDDPFLNGPSFDWFKIYFCTSRIRTCCALALQCHSGFPTGAAFFFLKLSVGRQRIIGINAGDPHSEQLRLPRREVLFNFFRLQAVRASRPSLPE